MINYQFTVFHLIDSTFTVVAVSRHVSMTRPPAVNSQQISHWFISLLHQMALWHNIW